MKTSNTALRLNEFMKKNGLKQIDIINRAKPFCSEYCVKLSKSDLSQYVSGKVEPGQDKLYVLAKALGVSEAWLMGYDVQSKPENEPIKVTISGPYYPEIKDKILNMLIKNYEKMTDSAKHALFEYSEFMISKPENLSSQKA